LTQPSINTLLISEANHQHIRYFNQPQIQFLLHFQVLEQFGVFESEFKARFLGCSRALLKALELQLGGFLGSLH
jgi:hypothetical protein